MAEVVRIRPAHNRCFDLSILDFDTTTNRWSVWSGFAFANVKDLINAKRETLRRAVIHTHETTPSRNNQKTAEFSTSDEAYLATFFAKHDLLSNRVISLMDSVIREAIEAVQDPNGWANFTEVHKHIARKCRHPKMKDACYDRISSLIRQKTIDLRNTDNDTEGKLFLSINGRF